MQIESTPEFDDNYLTLSVDDRRRVDSALLKLALDQRYPSLQFGKLPGQTDESGRDIWYFRASQSLRVTCVWENDVLFLRRVGHHDMLRNP